MERVRTQGLPNFFGYPLLSQDSGTCKATDFKFCRNIRRVDQNNSPWKMLGIVAVGVVRESRKFSGHPRIGHIEYFLCRSLLRKNLKRERDRPAPILLVVRSFCRESGFSQIHCSHFVCWVAEWKCCSVNENKWLIYRENSYFWFVPLQWYSRCHSRTARLIRLAVLIGVEGTIPYDDVAQCVS